MANPVGDPSLQPGLARRGAEGGGREAGRGEAARGAAAARPPDGFFLLLAGLTGAPALPPGSVPTAGPATPGPDLADAAVIAILQPGAIPAGTPASRSSGLPASLPWAALAAAAEEASQLAGQLQASAAANLTPPPAPAVLDANIDELPEALPLREPTPDPLVAPAVMDTGLLAMLVPLTVTPASPTTLALPPAALAEGTAATPPAGLVEPLDGLTPAVAAAPPKPPTAAVPPSLPAAKVLTSEDEAPTAGVVAATLPQAAPPVLPVTLTPVELATLPVMPALAPAAPPRLPAAETRSRLDPARDAPPTPAPAAAPSLLPEAVPALSAGLPPGLPNHRPPELPLELPLTAAPEPQLALAPEPLRPPGAEAGLAAATAASLPAPAGPALPANPVLVPLPAMPPHPRLLAEAAPQLALHLAQAAEQGQETVSVDLRPPELGRVELRLTFRDGQVQQVVVTAERAETFEALRQDRTVLLQQMEQAGLQLGQSGLDLQHGRPPPPDPEQAAPRSFRLAEAAEDGAAEPAAAPGRPASDSLIDIIA